MSMEMLSFIFGFGLLFIVVAAIIGVVMYVLYAFPLFQMAQNAGMENAWLAWIPIAQIYVLCHLAHNDVELFGQIKFSSRDNAFWTYIVLAVIAYVGGYVPIIGGLCAFVASIGMLVMMWKFNYDVIEEYSDSNNAMVISVLGAIFTIVMTIELWCIRNNKPKTI